MTDALAEYVEELRADETTVGLLLHGSRALGFERLDSDYDLICIVSDDSYAQRKAAAALLERRSLADGSRADVLYQSPGQVIARSCTPLHSSRRALTTNVTRTLPSSS
jgi:hypothetical protein